jgi:glycosyltransferase involved in cell wall biosynthesis
MIDVLLATFNGSKYLNDLLRSILNNQSPHTMNVVIYDDGSDDNTLDLINDFVKFNQARLINSIVSNRGVISSFSSLLQHSNSKFAFLCDQDDVWLPQKIEISLKKMQAMEAKYGQQTPILVHTDLTVVDQNLNVIYPSLRQYQNLDPYPEKLLPRLLVQNFVTGCTVLINKPLKDLVTPIPPEAIMHDWWIALTAAAFGKIAYIPEPSVLYRQHQHNSIGAKKWGMNYILSRLKNLKQIRLDIQKTIIQAQKFRETFYSQLTLEQLDILDTYINLPNQEWRIRKYKMIEKGYYQFGKLKNLGFLFCI